MRDRLIEMIKQKQEAGWRFTGDEYTTDVFNSELADYLIEQGVIVPPCKVGDAEVKHGEWVEDGDFLVCLNCESEIDKVNRFGAENAKNYCPHCGAKMDGGDGE